ncbi:MAG: zinc metalloprotease HtpX [bacterium]|nr:zinc metalloprotease HtpX [bacterium]
MNSFKTFLLLFSLSMLLLMVGGAIGGRNGMTIALVIAGAMNLISYWFSDKIVLAMYGAKEVSEADLPEVHRIVSNLCQVSGQEKPKVYLMPSASPNAFATGRDPKHSAVAVTQGIMKLLSRTELEGVIAHELAHIKNRDILVATIAATIATAIFHLADMAKWAAIFGGRRDDNREGNPIVFLAMIIVAPIAAMLIQMAISRNREYLADETGARLCGNPLGLAGALRKLAEGAERLPLNAKASTAHMFIVNPLSGGGIFKLFSTHPPIKERVERLEKMV